MRKLRKGKDPRHAKTDPFHQSCCSLRRWWKCEGEPRLSILRTYIARQSQVWRLYDEGVSGRAIGREIGVTESDIRYHLGRGRQWLATLAEGLAWLTDKVRNARNTVAEKSHGADWFKHGDTWKNGWFSIVRSPRVGFEAAQKDV